MGHSGADLHLEVIEATGHTEGHMALWERNGRVLIAGDHIVGVGSAVLDAKYHHTHISLAHHRTRTRTHAPPHDRARTHRS